MSPKKWLPLESNPDVLNDFSRTIGLLDTSKFKFCDIFGLDEELLQMVPTPVLAVLLLFPITPGSEAVKQTEDEKLKREGQDVSKKVFWQKQTIGNACGTIGVLHAIANNQDRLEIAKDSFLSSWLADTASLTPDERASYLEDPPEGAPDLGNAHQAAAEQGDTAAPSLDEVVDLHFVCFVHQEGGLYELDGRKSFPIFHGATTEASLLQDSVAVVRKFMDASHSINFNLMALAAISD